MSILLNEEDESSSITYVDINNYVYHTVIVEGLRKEGSKIPYTMIDSMIGLEHCFRQTYKIIDEEKFMLAKIRFGF
jgi:hypothetical protein